MSQHDLIVRGGSIITLDATSRTVEALGVRDGWVSAVGSEADVMRGRGPHTRTLDVIGKTIVPGFFDAHPHMDREGLKERGGIPLGECSSVSEIMDVVRAAASRTPRDQWIVLMPMGRGPTDYVYRPEQLKEGRFPTRRDLDEAAPNHSVYIRAPWGW